MRPGRAAAIREKGLLIRHVDGLSRTDVDGVDGSESDRIGTTDHAFSGAGFDVPLPTPR